MRCFEFGLGKKGVTPSLKLKFRDYPGGYHQSKATAAEKKFVRNEKDTKKLLEEVKKGYETLLNYFNSENLTPWIVSIITPVQTVGSVVFSRLEVYDNSNPHFYFRKVSHDAEYSPKDSEQPLRYLLRFLLKIHLDNRNWGIFNFLRDWLSLDEHLKKAVNEFARGCKTNGAFTVIKGDKWLNIKEIIIRSLAILALREELDSLVDTAVNSGGEYGFTVDLGQLKTIPQPEKLSSNNNIDNISKIGKNCDYLRQELALEMESNCLPEREGILVLITSIKSEDSLKKIGVWRGLSNRVESEEFIKVESVREKKTFLFLLIGILLAILVIIFLTRQ